MYNVLFIIKIVVFDFVFSLFKFFLKKEFFYLGMMLLFLFIYRLLVIVGIYLLIFVEFLL